MWLLLHALRILYGVTSNLSSMRPSESKTRYIGSVLHDIKDHPIDLLINHNSFRHIIGHEKHRETLEAYLRDAKKYLGSMSKERWTAQRSIIHQCYHSMVESAEELQCYVAVARAK